MSFGNATYGHFCTISFDHWVVQKFEQEQQTSVLIWLFWSDKGIQISVFLASTKIVSLVKIVFQESWIHDYVKNMYYTTKLRLSEESQKARQSFL